MAKIAITLQDELGHIPTHQEIDQVCLCTRVRHQVVLGLAGRRQQQRTGQLAIF